MRERRERVQNMKQKRIVVDLSDEDHASVKAEAKRRKETIRREVIEALRKAGYQIEDREE
jgi:site-specific DNA-cytosine methylase